MKSKTLIKTIVAVVLVGGAVAYFIIQTMQSSWSYYYSVDQFSANTENVQNVLLRIAGKVSIGSIKHKKATTDWDFILAGSQNSLAVHYTGSVPDNFAEGREVVVEGRMDNKGVFQAHSILTKCESKYQAKVK